jgi:hypothetical protein
MRSAGMVISHLDIKYSEANYLSRHFFLGFRFRVVGLWHIRLGWSPEFRFVTECDCRRRQDKYVTNENVVMINGHQSRLMSAINRKNTMTLDETIAPPRSLYLVIAKTPKIGRLTKNQPKKLVMGTP